jgi:uncharacterized membrane protein
MKSALFGYISSLAVFLGFDMIWLGFMASRFYRPLIGDMALEAPRLPPAFAFYALYPVGLFIFCVQPALGGRSPQAALLYGALFGFFTYATYDLTNQATLRNWPLQLTLVDVAWGTVLGAVAAFTGYWVANRFAAG